MGGCSSLRDDEGDGEGFMNWQPWLALWAYATVFVAAAVEGEVIFSLASVMVSIGKLDAAGVLLAGALGASAGDQFYFYAFRGRLRKWIDGIPGIARRRDLVTGRIQTHATRMILACRFLPGLRISIPVACAYAGVSPLRFSLLSLLSSLAWAAAVMGVITYLGPSVLNRAGISSWWTAVISAFMVLGFFWWLGRTTEGGSLLKESEPGLSQGSLRGDALGAVKEPGSVKNTLSTRNPE